MSPEAFRGLELEEEQQNVGDIEDYGKTKPRDYGIYDKQSIYIYI